MSPRRLALGFLLVLPLGALTPASAFQIDWQMDQRVGRAPHVTGYVRNDGVMAVGNLYLRVDRLAADGQVVGTTRATVIGPMWGGGDRLYFDVRVPDRDAAYRVSVERYETYRCRD